VFSEPQGGHHVAFDKSGDWLIAGAVYHGITGNPISAPDIRIWKVPTFQLIRTLTTDSGGALNQRMGGDPHMGIWGPVSGTHSVAACPSSLKLGVMSWDRSIRVFDLETLVESEKRRVRDQRSLNDRVLILDPVHELTRLRGGHLGQPTALAFDPSGSRIATADTLGTLKIWDISHPQEAIRYASSVRPANANDPEFQFGDSTIAIYSEVMTHDQIKFGVTQTTLGTQLIDLMDGSVKMFPQAVRMSKDGRMLATVVADRLHVRSVLDQKDTLIIDDVIELDSAPPLRTPPSFSLDPTGRRLAVQSRGHLMIWDVMSKRKLCDIASVSHGTFSDEKVSVDGIFDPTGQRIATFISGSSKDVICIWDVLTARLIAKVFSKEVCNDLFLGEDRLIAVGRDQLTCWIIPILRAPSALPLEQKIMAPSWTYQFASDLPRQGRCFVSDDFNRIVFASGPTTLIAIDACTGKVVTKMKAQQNLLDPVHISPDGSRFVLTTVDGRMHLHHIDGNRDVLDLGFLGFSDARFTSDGNKVVSVSPEGIVRVLDGTPWKE
jgi:WD40 repeat protein